MPGRAARIERRIKRALRQMAKEIELIGDVRGRGVLIGIELVTDRARKTPANAETQAVFERCLEAGLIFQVRGVRDLKNVIRLVPPMTSTNAEVDRAMDILYDAMVAVSRGARSNGRRSPSRLAAE